MKRVILLNIDIDLLGDLERYFKVPGDLSQRFFEPLVVSPKNIQIGSKQQVVFWTKHQLGMHGVGLGGGGVTNGCSSLGGSGSGSGASCGGGGGTYLKAKTKWELAQKLLPTKMNDKTRIIMNNFFMAYPKFLPILLKYFRIFREVYS